MGLFNKHYKSFDGTIIIGDPFVMAKNSDDRRKSNYGERFDLLGFKNYLYIHKQTEQKLQ